MTHYLGRWREQNDIWNCLNFEFSYSLAYYYGAPTVAISPTGANSWLNNMFGNPQSASLDPSNFLPYTERMTTKERVANMLMSTFERLTYKWVGDRLSIHSPPDWFCFAAFSTWSRSNPFTQITSSCWCVSCPTIEIWAKTWVLLWSTRILLWITLAPIYPICWKWAAYIC